MWCQEYDGDLEPLKYLNGGLGIMVRSAVKKDYSLLSPIGPQLIKLLDEGHEVYLHDVRVAVALCESKIGVTQVVNANDHGYPWAEKDGGN